ncbi:hypothetical protein HYH02_011359 [Chlamydomonas schloesseri]|uniref:Wax synthase domain-containing protein n=1 Tax=Chlamydomonas schloesseri TaxID=2026947 RepID=A0A835T495_9CHLO|nr:hypothetical protein HYH02_011359 [Chlamydomonas schloesseri]|eukprot:KAG2437101.1 hypothetical protein HYH02_011359 [Chlamydomonas schloesseri]
MAKSLVVLETGIASAWARLALLHLAFLGAAIWLKYGVGRARPGGARLVLATPILALSVAGPWIFNGADEVLPRLSTLFIFSWLCTFKVLAFCVGRAPLREGMTVAQLAAIMMLPVFPKPENRAKEAPEGRLQDTAGSGAALASRWLAKLVLLGAVVWLLTGYGDDMPGAARHYLYAFGMYAFVGFLMDGPGAVTVEALGLQLVPTFDAPWLSTSLADFWGRRWNITTSSVLRTLVYDPLAEGRLVPDTAVAGAAAAGGGATAGIGTGLTSGINSRAPSTSKLSARGGAAAGGDAAAEPADADAPGVSARVQTGAEGARREAGSGGSRGTSAKGAARPPVSGGLRPSLLRRQLGLHASFLISGLVHEYLAWNITGIGWHWKWTLFFYMQAPLMTLEGLGRRWLRRRGLPPPPRLLANLITVALLEAMAYPLFFGFVETNTDLAKRVVAAVSHNYQEVLQPLRPLLASAAAALAGGSGAAGASPQREL